MYSAPHRLGSAGQKLTSVHYMFAYVHLHVFMSNRENPNTPGQLHLSIFYSFHTPMASSNVYNNE